MFAVTTSGLTKIPGHSRTKRGWLYLNNDFEVIDYPTIWAAKVAKRKSQSPDTLNQYGSRLARWLRFLDDNISGGAQNWQAADRDVVEMFVDYLIRGRDEHGRPSDKTIEDYCAVITDFYRCAARDGYRHYWDMDNEEFKKIIKNKSATTVDVQVTALKREVTISRGQYTSVRSELNMFVHQQHLKKAMALFDDYVYVTMAYIMRNTGLRPKELLQLPYKGKGVNSGLQPYRIVEMEKTDDKGNTVTVEMLVTDDASRTCVTSDIRFKFESKGKDREIPFPPYVWRFICTVWMPMRNRRAKIYMEKHGVGPGDNSLFLSAEGRPVSYGMLIAHFNKVAKHPQYVKRPFTPKMLRHSFATYFVYEALKKDGGLRSDYVYNSAHDDELRKLMGHTDIGTTYKHYVHVVQIYVRKDIMSKLLEEADREINSTVMDLALARR